MTKQSDFLDRLERIVVYRKGNARAPHKPLYLLQCIAAIQHGLPRMRSFVTIESKLREALMRFGLRTQSVSPQYPFWRLQNDGLAIVEPTGPYVIRKQSDDPKKKSLLRANAHGGLLEGDYALLNGDLDLQTRVVHRILDGHFPRSIHEELVEFFDLRLSGARSSDHKTEFEFREVVLRAYGNSCAISKFSLSYRNSFPGLEAAHICWPQAGGNDDVCNGIAMTTLHRKLFHLGIFAIDSNMQILVCDDAIDTNQGPLALSKLAGQIIDIPHDDSLRPSLDALEWHRKWVFRG